MFLPLRLFCLIAVFFAFSQSTNNVGEPEELECALSLVNQLNKPQDKADALVKFAKLYLEAGDSESANKFLTDALLWTTQIEDGLFKAGDIVAVSEIGSLDHVERASEIAKTLGGSDRAWANRALIAAYCRLGLTDKAANLLTEAAAAIESSKTQNQTWYGDRDLELAHILADAAQAGLTNEALKISATIKDKYSKGDILRATAIKLIEQKHPRRAIDAARSIGYEVERIHALVDLADAASKSEDKSVAAEALSYALIETRKYPFDPHDDGKTKALVSIAVSYDNNGQRQKALTVLDNAEKVAETIEKPGFKDSGRSQVALAFARFGMFDRAMAVTDKMPSPWNSTKARTLATMAELMIDAGERERASRVLAQAVEVTKDIDCTYFKYGISARSCFGDKATDFIAIASAYEKAGLRDKQIELLDLAVLQNAYKRDPPHAVIDEPALSIGNEAVGEQQIVEGYLAAGEFNKAVEVAGKIKSARDRVVAVATIEFRLTSAKDKASLQVVGCR